MENLLEESVLSEIIQFGHHLKVALGAEAVEARGLTDAQCRDITESALRIQKALHPPTNALDSSGTE